MTTPAAETKSIGLLADAQLSWFLQRHLDSFIMTGQLRIIYRDFAKTHTNPDADGNFPYHRAVMVNEMTDFMLDNSFNTNHNRKSIVGIIFDNYLNA